MLNLEKPKTKRPFVPQVIVQVLSHYMDPVQYGGPVIMTCLRHKNWMNPGLSVKYYLKPFFFFYMNRNPQSHKIKTITHITLVRGS